MAGLEGVLAGLKEDAEEDTGFSRQHTNSNA
jgi:hypothetical protein